MSEDGYSWYLNQCKEYAENNKDAIKECKKEVPQHILWAKTVSDELKDEANDCGYKTIDDKFYLTEKMVNRLMYFAYLKGSKSFDEKSYKKGWSDCIEDVAKKLDLYTDLDFDDRD